MIDAQFHRYDQVNSTNDIALAMARDGAAERTVVTALAQTKGRGRRGRTWHSGDGESVLMSIILRPQMTADRYAELAFVACLAVVDCIEREGCEHVAVKWPNDVLVHEHKIAGILIETNGDAAVVGIGLNANQADFPADICETATSLMLESGSTRNVERLSTDLANDVLRNYMAYSTHGFKEILDRWKNYMWGVGRSVEVVTECERLQGEIVGVDSSGALVIKDINGNEHIVVAAEEMQIL